VLYNQTMSAQMCTTAIEPAHPPCVIHHQHLQHGTTRSSRTWLLHQRHLLVTRTCLSMRCHAQMRTNGILP
jgi:hypothetical protein